MRINEILTEARIKGVDYIEDPKTNKVTARLAGQDSRAYTMLAKRTKQIQRLKEMIKIRETEVKNSTKENISDLFDVADAVNTRVVDTLSFIMTLSKDPEPATTVQYKKVLDELVEHLTPELIKVQQTILAKYSKVGDQKEPSLKITQKVKESFGQNLFTRFKQLVMSWTRKYDKKLDQLKHIAGVV